MSFVAPAWLLLLLLLPAALAGYAVAQRRRHRYAVRFTNLDLLANVVDQTPGWRRHVPPALYLLALSAALIAVARPQTTVAVPREKATVMLVTDISGSMNATDVEPTRLAAAQAAARDLLAQLPSGFQVGLISFSNTVNVLVQPTTDREAILAGLDGLRPRGGTAMGDALVAALDTLEQAGITSTPVPRGGRTTPAPTPTPTPLRPGQGSPTNVIVLLSDGAQTLGITQPEEAADEAAIANVPIYTVALGTPNGIAEVTDNAGRVRQVRVPPDPETLQLISEITRAKSFEAPTAEDLHSIYKDIGSRIGYDEEDREIAYVFAGAAALLLAAAGGLSLWWFNRFP